MTGSLIAIPVGQRGRRAETDVEVYHEEDDGASRPGGLAPPDRPADDARGVSERGAGRARGQGDRQCRPGRARCRGARRPDGEGRPERGPGLEPMTERTGELAIRALYPGRGDHELGPS